MALTKEGLNAIAGGSTLAFLAGMKAGFLNELGSIVFHDKATGGVYRAAMLIPPGSRGRLWVGERFIKRLKAAGLAIPIELFEDTYDVPLTDIEDHSAFENGQVLGKQLFEAAQTTEQEEILDVLRKNKESPFTGSPMFGTHTFLQTDNNGNVVKDENGAPVVAQTIVNDIVAAEGEGGAYWYVMAERAILAITQEEFTAQHLTGDSDRAFFYDVLTAGLRGRKAYTPGLCYTHVRSNKPLTAESYQEALDLAYGFRNPAGERMLRKYPYLVVEAGTAPALAADYLVNQAQKANGESNIYTTRGIKIVTI